MVNLLLLQKVCICRSPKFLQQSSSAYVAHILVVERKKGLCTFTDSNSRGGGEGELISGGKKDAEAHHPHVLQRGCGT